MEDKYIDPFDEDTAKVYEIYKALEHLLTDKDRKMFKKYNSLPENEKHRMNNRLIELIDQIPGDYDRDLTGDGLTTREYVKSILFNGMSDFEDDFGSPILTDKQYDDLINSYRGIKTESSNKYIKSFREAVEKLKEGRKLDLDIEEDEKVNRDNIEMYRRKISAMSAQEKARSLGIDKFLEQANELLNQAIDVLDKQQDLYNTYSGPNAYF